MLAGFSGRVSQEPPLGLCETSKKGNTAEDDQIIELQVLSGSWRVHFLLRFSRQEASLSLWLFYQ